MKTTNLVLCVIVLMTILSLAGEARLPNGGLYQTGVLRVTFHDDFSGRISLAANGKAREVRKEDIVSIHPGIERVEAKHLCARQWLSGGQQPAHIKKKGKVPLIARNLNVILKDGVDTLQAAAELRKQPEVERVSLVMLYQPDALPNDPSYGAQWGMNRIGVPDGDWDVPGRGRIRVAIVDTGIDRQHPDLAARIVFGAGYTDQAPPDGDAQTDGRSAFDHGTHVAGIVAAIRNNMTGVAGVSNNIDLMAMGCSTWSSSQGTYLISNAGDAIADAVANGARVINCSFGKNRANGQADIDDEQNEALDLAYDQNVMVVVSAGNNGMNTDNHDWAQSAVPFIISASMRTIPVTDPEVFDTNFSNSNFGARIDLCAPGGQILSTVPTRGPPGSLEYLSQSGTSMAAPHVAGAAAHIMSMNPGLLEDHSAKHLLIRMAQDAGPMGRDDQYGWGLLRLRREYLQVLRNADTFVSSVELESAAEPGVYETPHHSIGHALDHVADNAVIVLNGGNVTAASFHYPAITITKPCVLTALPDKPVIIGQ